MYYGGFRMAVTRERQARGATVIGRTPAHSRVTYMTEVHDIRCIVAGVLLYLLPLGAGQGKGDSTHGWGTPLHSFWCCYGSSVESFAKLVDSIYFYR